MLRIEEARVSRVRVVKLRGGEDERGVRMRGG